MTEEAGGMGQGGVEAGGLSPERKIMPEALRTSQELYTVEGADLIVAVKEAVEKADMESLHSEIEQSLSFMEGLYLGQEAEDYDLEKEVVQTELLNMFTTVEGSIDRPAYTQLFYAIRDSLTHPVREAKRYNKNKESWEKNFRKERGDYWSRYEFANKVKFDEAKLQKQIGSEVGQEKQRFESVWKNRYELQSLKDHVDSRIMIFDPLFTMRQKNCKVDQQLVEAQGAAPEPDKGHWISFYQGNIKEGEEISSWGDAVNRVEMVIEKIGTGEIRLPESIGENGENNSDTLYARGFTNTGEFTAWLKELLKHSEIDDVQRLDVVWAAWKMSLVKENITKLAWYVDEDGKYNFGNPTFASDLMQKLIHSDKLRANEYKWQGLEGGTPVDIDGDGIIRNPKPLLKEGRRGYLAISHSGHPLSIGRIGKLTDEYMSRTILKKWINPKTKKEIKDISLREIMMNKEILISQADPAFPWRETEIKTGKEPPGEPASGTWSLWNLDRYRGYDVRGKIITKIPESRELQPDYFQQSVIRAMDKLKLIKPGEVKKGGEPNNPFAWWLSGVLQYRSQSMIKENPYSKTDKGFRLRSNVNRTANTAEGRSVSDASDLDILGTVLDLNLISKEEYRWLVDNIVGEAY